MPAWFSIIPCAFRVLKPPTTNESLAVVDCVISPINTDVTSISFAVKARSPPTVVSCRVILVAVTSKLPVMSRIGCMIISVTSVTARLLILPPAGIVVLNTGSVTNELAGSDKSIDSPLFTVKVAAPLTFNAPELFIVLLRVSFPVAVTSSVVSVPAFCKLIAPSLSTSVTLLADRILTVENLLPELLRVISLAPAVSAVMPVTSTAPESIIFPAASISSLPVTVDVPKLIPSISSKLTSTPADLTILKSFILASRVMPVAALNSVMAFPISLIIFVAVV